VLVVRVRFVAVAADDGGGVVAAALARDDDAPLERCFTGVDDPDAAAFLGVAVRASLLACSAARLARISSRRELVLVAGRPPVPPFDGDGDGRAALPLVLVLVRAEADAAEVEEAGRGDRAAPAPGPPGPEPPSPLPPPVPPALRSSRFSRSASSRLSSRLVTADRFTKTPPLPELPLPLPPPPPQSKYRTPRTLPSFVPIPAEGPVRRIPT